jgi:hypothetical protein
MSLTSLSFISFSLLYMSHELVFVSGFALCSFSNIYQLSKECQSLIPHYDLIQEVNITRNNLLQTKAQLENLLSILKKVSSLF